MQFYSVFYTQSEPFLKHPQILRFLITKYNSSNCFFFNGAVLPQFSFIASNEQNVFPPSWITFSNGHHFQMLKMRGMVPFKSDQVPRGTKCPEFRVQISPTGA